MVIHPTAIVADDAKVGEGTIIGEFALVGIEKAEATPLSLGEHCVVRSHSVLYRGSTIGARAQFGHGVLVRESCRFGDDVSVGSHSVVEHMVALGNRVRLHSNCFVPEFSVLEDGAWLGPGVIVTNARYPNRPDTKQNLDGVSIGESATVGAGAVLMPGIRIGAGALIGAGAVVLRDVPDGGRVVGNPGRLL